MIPHAPIADPGLSVALDFSRSVVAVFTRGFFYSFVTWPFHRFIPMRHLVRAVLVLALARPLAAQALPPDSVLARMAGRWVLRGTIAQQPTVHDVTFTWRLNRSYLEMHEVSRERTTGGTPAYEAMVLFTRDPTTGEYACLWLDNTGVSAFEAAGIGRGAVAGDSVPFLFRYTPTTRFHTTFVYDRARDRWQWHMDNDSVGIRRPFARVTLTRR